jgi:hypothetical protein
MGRCVSASSRATVITEGERAGSAGPDGPGSEDQSVSLFAAEASPSYEGACLRLGTLQARDLAGAYTISAHAASSRRCRCQMVPPKVSSVG